jgi:hypothetical protein
VSRFRREIASLQTSLSTSILQSTAAAAAAAAAAVSAPVSASAPAAAAFSRLSSSSSVELLQKLHVLDLPLHTALLTSLSPVAHVFSPLNVLTRVPG